MTTTTMTVMTMTTMIIIIIIIVISIGLLLILQDFESDRALKQNVKDLLDEMMNSPSLLPAEYKAANVVACALLKEEDATKSADRLEAILAHPEVCTF